MLDPFEGRELKICYTKPISDQNKKQKMIGVGG